MSLAAAILGAQGLGAVSQFFGSKKAAEAQAQVAREQIAAIMSMYNTTRADLAPYRDMGGRAINPLMELAGMTGDPNAVQSRLEQLPGYQFALSQGMKGINNQAAARGLSGAQLKAGSRYATGLADQTFGNQFNRLLEIMRTGQNAAAQTGTFGANASGGVAGALGGMGDAKAAMYNSWGNTGQNLANTAGNMYLTQQFLDRMQPTMPQNYGSLGQNPLMYGR